jgi:hypothetical protein
MKIFGWNSVEEWSDGYKNIAMSEALEQPNSPYLGSSFSGRSMAMVAQPSAGIWLLSDFSGSKSKMLKSRMKDNTAKN